MVEDKWQRREAKEQKETSNARTMCKTRKNRNKITIVVFVCYSLWRLNISVEFMHDMDQFGDFKSTKKELQTTTDFFLLF